MLDFSLTEEQNMIRTMVRDFGKNELAPGAKERSEKRSFPRELVKKMGDLGLMGLNIPEKYGGEHKDMVTIGLVIEELARWAGDASIYAFNSFAGSNFLLLGTEEIKEEWLTGLARGEKTVNMGATEAEAGSDLSNLKTVARKDGDYYILNGEKNHVSLAEEADGTIVLARPDIKSKLISPYLVPLNTPGVTMSRIEDAGSEATPGGILSMQDVRIPANHLLGDAEGKGFAQTMRTFDCNRALLALMSVAKADISVEETCEYTKQRVQFGKPLAKFEGISFRLAEAATYIEMCRWLCYKTLWMKDQNMRHTKESAMVKWFCSERSFEIIHQCVLMHGHYGYTKDLPLERRLREVLGEQTGDGAPEIMKIIISREMLGREFLPY